MCRGAHTGTATLVIPGDSVLRVELLEMFYYCPVGGHLGLYYMVHWLAHRYYWRGIYYDCQTHTRNCLICNLVNLSTKISLGKLQPLPIPMYPFEEVTLDLITHLPCVPAG